MDNKEKMARRAALELEDGSVVNLGFGMPTDVANFIPSGINVILETENGALGVGPTPKKGEQDSDYANAGGAPITLIPGASIFDANVSFGIIRGGHVDVAILGALEVDQEGNLANWSMPKNSPGMGGAMDLVTGAKKIIVMMQHNAKDGNPKIRKKCTLPLTGVGVVDVIITEKAVFDVTTIGLVLKEIAQELTVDDIKKSTEAEFTVDPALCEYRF